MNNENYLEQFYGHLAAGDENAIYDMQIPHSSIFYAREAIKQATGRVLSLAETQRYLEEEFGG